MEAESAASHPMDPANSEAGDELMASATQSEGATSNNEVEPLTFCRTALTAGQLVEILSQRPPEASSDPSRDYELPDEEHRLCIACYTHPAQRWRDRVHDALRHDRQFKLTAPCTLLEMKVWRNRFGQLTDRLGEQA